ncbi:MAG: hypothetical protein JWP89_3420 [Schlesneria sp.]|nr:hypothetical protein [Schlesneria sp.]
MTYIYEDDPLFALSRSATAFAQSRSRRQRGDRADSIVSDSMKSPEPESKRAAPRSSEARQNGYELDEL